MNSPPSFELSRKFIRFGEANRSFFLNYTNKHICRVLLSTGGLIKNWIQQSSFKSFCLFLEGRIGPILWATNLTIQLDDRPRSWDISCFFFQAKNCFIIQEGLEKKAVSDNQFEMPARSILKIADIQFPTTASSTLTVTATIRSLFSFLLCTLKLTKQVKFLNVCTS